jgi:large subunit ribosomal protein L24
MKIRAGDTVYVMSGKDKGKSGTVLRVLVSKNRVVVEGINMRVRHIKKTTQGPGQRIKYEAALSVSNVAILDPKTKKPTRIGYKVDEKGRKVRFAKGSGEVIAAAATAKAEAPKKKTGAKTTAKSKKEDKEEEKTDETKATGPAAKQPFWKRAFSGAPDGSGADQNRTNADAANPATQIHRSSEGG